MSRGGADGVSGGGRGYIERLSEDFERIGGWCYDRRRPLLALCLLLLAASAPLVFGVRFDNSFEAYFDRGDPAYAAYLEFREDFGSDEVAYLLYQAPERPHGPWDLEVMRAIAQLTEALEQEVPFAKQVISLANVEFLDPIPDGIEIHDLLESFPEDQEELLEIRSKVLQKPIYVGGLASADGRYAAVVIEMEKSSVDPLEEIRLDPEGGDGLENLYPQVSYRKIEEILARPEYRGITFHHSGDVPFNAVLNQIVESEGARLGAICLAMIAVALLCFFRSPIGTLGPMVVVVLSIMGSLALVRVLGWKLDLMFGMLPTLLAAVGVADSVHIISEFRAQGARLGDRREALRRTLYLVGPPCLLTSLTTAAGFGAMSIAPIKSLAHFAVYSAAGVLAAFLLSVTLLIVFLAFGRRSMPRETSERARRRVRGGRLFNRAVAAIAGFDSRHRTAILAASAAVFVVSLFGIARLRVDSNFLNDFSEEVPIRNTMLYVDEVMGGTNSFVYLFDTGVPDGVKDPEVLREIERLQARADTHGEIVNKTYSIVDILKDINRTFHDGDSAYHALPGTRELVAQYLLLYEMSGGDELEQYVSSDYARASLELRCKWSDSSLLAEMAGDLGAYLESEPLRASTTSMTGIGALWLALMDYITQSQIRGFLLAFIAIAAMMCALFRSFTIGLLSMLPNLAPVVLTLGIMGWLDVPLDYTRLLVAPVAIGIAVDSTIHMLTRLRHEFLVSGSYERALRASLADVGRALFITSTVLVLGFLVFLASRLESQASFGVLLATTIALALLANVVLLPALVLALRPFGPEGRRHALTPSSRAG